MSKAITPFLGANKLQIHATVYLGAEVSAYEPGQKYDRIYCSSIFTWSARPAIPEGTLTGGTGFDIRCRLPEDIEEIKPHKNHGFTSRGCIRKCGFCLVPAKEGTIRKVGSLLDLWDGGSENVTVYDNNILALPEHFVDVCHQAQQKRIKVDFNQGLDHRLLSAEIVSNLKQTPHHGQYRFAFDSPAFYPTVKEAVDLLIDNGIRYSTWYVLVGFNTTFIEDLERVYFLRDRRQTVFVQRYNRSQDKRLIALSRWANNRAWFFSMRFSEFLARPENEGRYWRAFQYAEGGAL